MSKPTGYWPDDEEIQSTNEAMTTTSTLPEAFRTKMWNAKADYLTIREKGIWAEGYNACLEATGARELWEAAVHCERILSVTEPHSEMVKLLRAALSKHTNTV